MANALIIFMKNPILGKIKTRLAKSIGNEAALSIYKALLRHTREITAEIPCTRYLYYSEFIDTNDEWDPSFFEKRLQSGKKLGDRMAHSFETCLEDNKKAVIIGSDCLELTPSIIKDAFESLDTYDIVIGPARDGGYYLLGMKEMHAEIFQVKEWSTSNVFLETIAIIQRLKLRHHELPLLSDIDTYEDLKKSSLREGI